MPKGVVSETYMMPNMNQAFKIAVTFCTTAAITLSAFGVAVTSIPTGSRAVISTNDAQLTLTLTQVASAFGGDGGDGGAGGSAGDGSAGDGAGAGGGDAGGSVGDVGGAVGGDDGCCGTSDSGAGTVGDVGTSVGDDDGCCGGGPSGDTPGDTPGGDCISNCNPPCTVNCNPCTVNCNPCTVNCNPCVENCNPCTVDCNPCTVDCNPCTVNCNPCTVNCNPCTVNCNPPCSGGGCGGGLNPPNVFLFKKPGEQPLAFVSLSQIPYTGYEAGPLGTALFWLFLLGWSAFAAYLIAIKRLPMRLIEKYAQGAVAAHSMPHIDASHEHEAQAMTHISHVAPTPTKIMRSTLAAERPVYTPAISKVAVHETPVAVSASRSGEASDYVSAVPFFIGWIANGESEKAFEFLRNLRLTKKSAQEFMEKTVCELDDAYRCRIDNVGEVNEHTKAAIASLSNLEVEKLIDALASAVDRSYGSEYTSAKIALVKALGIKGTSIAPVAHEVATVSAQVEEEVEPVYTAAPVRSQDYTDDFILEQINRAKH